MGIIFAKVNDQSRRVKIGQQNPQYCKNKVDTTKYNLITFIPKCILYQFLKLSNIVFLVNAVLQSIPSISSLSPITAIAPLGFVLAVSLLREAFEDYKRHIKDWQINSRITHVLRSGQFIQIDWDQVKVGDFVKVFNQQIIPADLLILSSSEQNSICYIQTANLDGESNLKQKFAFTQTIKLYPHEFEDLKGHCIIDSPKSNLYQFQGDITIDGTETHQLNYSNLVLRQTVLKNTNEIVGMALYCGYDTKILKNQGQINHKISQVQKKINYIQIGLICVLVFMCIVSSIGFYVLHTNQNLRISKSYIPSSEFSLPIQSGLAFFTIFLMLNFLIPISLNIVIQGIKAFSGIFLSIDKKLYDKKTKRYCNVLNTSIIEQLGVIDCILTDKTGTLTANQMIFKKIALKDKIMDKDTIIEKIEKFKNDRAFTEFWLSLILCHNVVKDAEKDQFQGSSPDEVCFINFADDIGYSFIKRTKNYIEINFQSHKMLFELIDILPFSNRKRMSVIVKNIGYQKEILVLTKGADSCIFDKAQPYEYGKILNDHLNEFAKEGLRTLVFAKRIINTQTYQKLSQQRNKAKIQYKKKVITKEQYLEIEELFIQKIEENLTVLGATGIQDRLQEDVPQTLQRLQQAGIKIMMVTGDKLQTAENIGYLAKLLKQDDIIYRLSAKIDNVMEQSRKIVLQIQQKHTNIAVIIQGRQISKIIKQKDPQNIKIYCKLLSKAKSVIFCRSSPKEKALIVKFVKDNMNLVVLAIGDGGNDVGMIEQAHIGVGILGKQGNSASSISDFSFSKFKFLDRLILHHGRWFYYRYSYFFIFFGWKNVIITFIIFFYLMECAFSGSYNYTQTYYLLYNSLFGISFIVNFGLYDQDINDDLEPRIWAFIPQIYLQTKKKELFSYKRYFTWFVIGIFISIFVYITIRFGISSVTSFDEYGRIPDIKVFKIVHGVTLVFIITIIIYVDTRTRTYFFQIFVAIICTVIPTVSFFLCENYLQLLEYVNVYEDAFKLRNLFIVLLPVMFIYVIQYTYHYYCVQYHPSLIDTYLKAKYQDKIQNDRDLNYIMTGSIKNLQLQINKVKQIDRQQPKQQKQQKINQNTLKKQKQNNIQQVSELILANRSSMLQSNGFEATKQWNKSFAETTEHNMALRRGGHSQQFTLVTQQFGNSNINMKKVVQFQDISQL